MLKSPDLATAMLDGVIDAFATAEWDSDTLMTVIGDIGEQLTMPRKARQLPVRVALTGRDRGIPLGDILDVLGRDETLRRLQAARARL